MISGLYIIKNLSNNKAYVGSSSNLKLRFKNHKQKLINGNHENKHLQRSWNKYGKDNFLFKIAIICNANDLAFFEQKLIDKFKSSIGWDNMYNQFPTSFSAIGRKHSEETKIKISQSNKGKIFSKEHRERIGKSRIYHTGPKCPSYGRLVSEETKKKMSESAKKRFHPKLSEETKLKISRSHMGIAPWNKGLKHSESTKLIMSQKKLDWYRKRNMEMSNAIA